jgi:hypothetical protein
MHGAIPSRLTITLEYFFLLSFLFSSLFLSPAPVESDTIAPELIEPHPRQTPATFCTMSESDLDNNDVEIIELRTATENILSQAPAKDATKRFNQLQCPICFDDVTNATVTLCGHVFCLECILQSISSSAARGQTQGKLGVGLCPLCRKRVNFKDTTLLRMKLAPKLGTPPPLDTIDRHEVV